MRTDTPAASPRGTGRRRALRVAFLVAVLCGLCLVTSRLPAAGGNEAPIKRVLVLYSDDRLLPANVLTDQRLRDAFRDRPGRPFRVEYFSEFLDVTRFPGRAHAEEVVRFFREKYGASPPDLVVAVGRGALDFLLSRRAALFGSSPIVACGVSTPGPSAPPRASTGEAGVTGAYVDVKAWSAGTLELALRLRPETRRIVLVGGTSPFDRRSIANVQRSFDPIVRSRGLAVTVLTDRPLDDILAELSRLSPRDTVVFYAAIMRDASGKAHLPGDLTGRISEASSAPVFGWYSTYVGNGIIGGVMTPFGMQGEAAGELALRVLAGEDADAVPPRVAPLATVLDARQMRRWGIPRDRLPAGADVRFDEPAAWEQYRMQIVGGSTGLIGQTALIAALLVHRMRRRRAEHALRAAQDDLAHVNRVASMGEIAASIAHEVNQPLCAIAANANACLRWMDRGISLGGADDEMREALRDVVQDADRASAVIQRVRGLLKKESSERTPVGVNALVGDILALVRSERERAGVTLETDLADGLPPVLADRVQIQQVLLNLFINAFEAMATAKPDGRRQVLTVRTRQESGTLHVEVSDTGPGLSPDERDRVFQAFYSSKAEGMGMGLAISRTIAEAHGGRLYVAEDAAAPGVGATFHFTLPTAPG